MTQLDDDEEDLIGVAPATVAVKPQTPSRQCVRTKANGERCRKSAIAGGSVCRFHGGANPRTAARAAVRATVAMWGLNDELVDPGETLLRLVSQSARRAAFYSELLAQAYAAEEKRAEQDSSPDDVDFTLPSGVAALIGKKYRFTPDGERVELEETIRGLVQLETAERKLCADFASKAIAAGLAERQVRVAEQLGNSIVAAIMVALDRAGVVGPARLEAQNAASDYLLELNAS